MQNFDYKIVGHHLVMEVGNQTTWHYLDPMMGVNAKLNDNTGLPAPMPPVPAGQYYVLDLTIGSSAHTFILPFNTVPDGVKVNQKAHQLIADLINYCEQKRPARGI